jgi:hypothetical protein
MNIRRSEFVAEIKRLTRELADASIRLSELEEFANARRSIATAATIAPENTPFAEDENRFAAKVAFGMLRVRMKKETSGLASAHTSQYKVPRPLPEWLGKTIDSAKAAKFKSGFISETASIEETNIRAFTGSALIFPEWLHS